MPKQRLEQKQGQSLTAEQIQFLGLLQIPIDKLEKRIEDELEENPALEEDEESDGNANNMFYQNYSKNNYEKYPIEDNSETLYSYLISQLINLNLKDELTFLIKYLINSLDERGFLQRDLYSISSDILTSYDIEVKEQDLNKALRLLKSLEPIGIGAKNLQECLLIQLSVLHKKNHIAYKIISEHYSAFSNKNFENITKKLNISDDELKKVYKIIEQLNPIPSSGYSNTSSTSEYIFADFTIFKNESNKLTVQINKGGIKGIKLSNYYSKLLLETNDVDTKKFLKQKIEKAKWFKEAIEKRGKTLKLVMEAIVKKQEKYFLSGDDKDLKPMKLADIARVVNMDISTVSRVSNSKYIETDFGTFKVKELFSDAYRKDNGEKISTNIIKLKLKEVISSENKKNPYTDEKISEILGKDEYHIARRTVTKYREQMGIENAKLRRSL